MIIGHRTIKEVRVRWNNGTLHKRKLADTTTSAHIRFLDGIQYTHRISPPIQQCVSKTPQKEVRDVFDIFVHQASVEATKANQQSRYVTVNDAILTVR